MKSKSEGVALRIIGSTKSRLANVCCAHDFVTIVFISISRSLRPMLTPAIIAHLRLQNQQIARSKFATPQEVVAWHGAKQAQEYTHAKWAIGLRLPEATDQIIEQAIDAGTIVRTHILRPTWHFVSAADIRWMMRLTAPQIVKQSIAREHDLGLDADTFNRTNEVIVKALEGGHQLTRQELAEAIERAGIMTSSFRMVHIMFRAELELLVCNGIFKPIVVVNGRVAGVWSRAEKKDSVLIEHQLFKDVSTTEKEGMARAAARFGRFLGKETVIK